MHVPTAARGSFAMGRITSPHTIKTRPLHLELCRSELAFGILTSVRLPVSYTGLAPDKITPMLGVPKYGEREGSAQSVLKPSSSPRYLNRFVIWRSSLWRFQSIVPRGMP